MTAKNTFDILFLIARPAAGKSEIIDFLKKTDPQVRAERYHVGRIEEIDDFPLLWAWFEEDDILSQKLGQPRLHTDADGYFKHHYLWDLLIERLCLEYRKKLRDNPDYHRDTTAIVEFSRGKEHGGFRRAFQHVDEDMLRKGGIVYVNVSWEESLRKNRRRFNPDRPDSILEHGLSDEKMERLYRESDWEEFSAGNPEFITIKGVRVPYVVFENEDDVTTGQPALLAQRLEEVLGRLWALKRQGSQEQFESGAVTRADHGEVTVVGG